MQILGERLKQMRLNKGLTQSAIADSMNIKRSTYSLYESGKREPNIDTLQKIANFHNISIDELLTNEEHMILTINDELSRLDTITRQYIKIIEENGYSVKLGVTDVEIIDKKRNLHTVSRKDFMSMLQYCHNDIEINLEKLLRSY